MPGSPTPTLTELSQLAAEALQALARLGEATARYDGLGNAARSRLDQLILPVPVSLSGALEEERLHEESQRLVGLIRSRTAMALKARSAFREGRVYCFWCDVPDCIHTIPPHRGDTFAGYSPIGKPEWQSFVNLCIDENDERVDLIYDDPPEVIARIQTARTLGRDLLPAFGRDSMVFQVVGQVVAGLIPIDLKVSRWNPNPSTARVALTLQILSIHSAVSGPRFKLNLLGLTVDELLEAAAEARPREAAERLRRTLGGVRHKLEVLSRKAGHAEQVGEPFPLEEQALPLLEELKGDVERLFRLPPRTLHAHLRHQSRLRPTSNALGDVRTAPFDRYYYDAEGDTLVVLGPKMRAHVFSPDGRHVTSLQLMPGELERKVQKTRWQPLVRERSLEVRENILQHTVVRAERAGASERAGSRERAGGSERSTGQGRPGNGNLSPRPPHR